MSLIISIIANSVGLYVASVVVPGFTVDPTVPLYYFLIAGLVFTIIFSIVLPIVKLISFPIIFLTLGLFSFILNLIAFYTLDQLLTGLEFNSILAMILTSIVISSINMLSNVFLR
jgi:putative membrane protein